MRKKLLLIFTVFFTVLSAFSQDFSNKGKDFYLCFPSHCPTGSGTLPRLSIFITSDQASTGTITMPNGAYSATFNLNAVNNYYQEFIVNPSGLPGNIYITAAQSNTVINKSIRVKTDAGQPAVVVYTEEWAGARTAATLVLPVNVLGKKYYAVSATQVSPSGSSTVNGISYVSKSHFQIIATQNNTNVQITPRFNGVKQLPFTINLPNAGDLYQYAPATSNIDITGSYIESLAGGMGGCLPIAVFSGTSGINLGAAGCTSANSSDPLFQQLYPTTSWGKNFGFIPFANYVLGSPYRIIASEDNTKIYFNGILVATLNAGDLYPNNYAINPPTITTPTNITADKEICVAQFLQSNGCSNTNGTQGDPDMVILNPIEQNIRDITVFSSSEQAITQRFVNVLISTAGTSSFMINNAAPSTSWLTSPNLPGYSYLRGEPFPSTGSYRLFSDSGFNAIAYGYGANESYAYSAGTNVRDLSQVLELETQYGNETSPSICTSAPFKFKVYFPHFNNATPPVYIPFDSLDWNITDPSIIIPNNFPIRYINPIPDSSNMRNGKLVDWYSLPGFYNFNTAGVDTLVLTGYKSTNEGCGTSLDYRFKIDISDPPTASFSVTPGGCYTEAYKFNETTPQLPKGTYRWYWDFGDGTPPVTGTRTPSHTYAAPGPYTIRHSSITTAGCLSDTVEQTIVVPDLPLATISGNATTCINTGFVPITFNGTLGTPEYIFSYTVDYNGGGPGPVQTTPLASTGGNYVFNAPTNVAGQFVYKLVGVRNATPLGTPCTRVITGQSITVNITPDATVTLTSAANTNNQTVCINTPIINITYAIGGSGTNGTVTGLPTGVTGTYAGGVVTITGIPTVAGPFGYTVSTSGPCLTPSVTGTITVTADGTLALTSAVGSDNQTLCINTPLLTNISYAVGGSGTGGTVIGLPAGVTGVFAGGVITISGTPTVAGTFNYTVTTTGPCIKPTATGTITVIGDATLTLTSTASTTSQTVCINNAIVNITYAVGGTGTGGSVAGLPTGVTGTYTGGVITITGTPTVSGIFNYTVTTTGPCVKPSAIGTITVTADGTLALTSAVGSDNQTLCINTALLTSITYAVGGSGTGGSVTGLPAGITGVFAGGIVTISGTPSVAGTFNYTVTTTGPCIKPTATGTIIVTGDATLTLTSAASTTNQSLCINVPIVNITYNVGGTGNGGAVTGLPTGVNGIFAGGVITISGTPTQIGTFNYTVTTTGPCVKPSAFGIITVNPDASIVLTSAVPTTMQELCRNSTIVNITYAISGGGTGAGVTGLPTGVSGVYAGGIFTISGTPTVAGTFNYTVTTTGTCAQNSLGGTILVNQLPTANYTHTTPACDTRTIVFTDVSVANSGALNQWTWDFGDPASGANNTANIANPSHVFTGTGPFTVKLTVATDKGCVSNPIATQTFTINHRPKAGFISPDVCINDVATVFTDTSRIAVGGFDPLGYEWNFGDGSPNTFTKDGVHLYAAPNTYMVTHIVTSTFGCKDTIIQPIVISSADPVSNFTVNNSCSSDSVELTNLSTVGYGNVTRLEVYWDFAGSPVFETIIAPGFNGIYKHKYPTLQTTQTYSIRVIAYSGVICFNINTKQVTVYATPRVQFNAIPASCLLVAPYQLTQGSEIGGVPGTGTYAGIGITNPNGTFDPQVAGIGTFAIKYTFTASNAGACIDTLTRFITVLDTAHAIFTFVSPSCEQVATSFTDVSTAPASVVPSTTVWNFNDGTGLITQPAGATFNHVFALPNTYTVTMHTVSAYGCLSTDTSALVTIDPNHHISSPGNNNQSVCINTQITPITYTLSGGATNATVGNLPPGLVANVVGTTLTITGAPTSTLNSPYNFTVQTTGNTCLVANAAGSITVLPDHSIALTSANDMQSVCVNTPIDDITYDLGGGANAATVTGLPAGVTSSITGTVLTISGTPTSTVGTPFAYSILTSGNACVKANATGEIKVNPYPVPSFTFDKGSYCIPNALVGFINTTTPAPTSLYTYVWDFNDGSTSTSVNPSHLFTSAGPFNVKLTATSTVVLNNNVIGCASSKTNRLDIIHPQPKADFVFNKPAICIGDNVTLTDATDGMGSLVNAWHWDLGDGTIRTNNPITYTYADTLPYNITMYSVNGFGCNSDTVTKTFNVYPYPYINMGADRSVLEGGQITLEPSVFARQPQFLWTPSQYLNQNNIKNPVVVKPLTDMTYTLTVTAQGGCALSKSVFVKLLKFPTIPNTFTPNHDGINDEWRIDFLNTYPDNRVQIFTRSGQLVFESKGYNKPWDGTIKGKPLPFDTYYYIIEPGSGRDPITGYVTIIK